MVEAEVVALYPVRYPKTVTKNRRTQMFRASVDTDQTITLNIGILVAVITVKVSDGTTITSTFAGVEAVTITEAALVDEDIVGFAIGAAPA